MKVSFDHDAEGFTDLEAYNYVPKDWDVIGNLIAAEVLMNRYGENLIFEGVEHDSFSSFKTHYYNSLDQLK